MDLPELGCLDELLSNPDDIQHELDGGVCSESSKASAISTRFANPVGDDEVKAI